MTNSARHVIILFTVGMMKVFADLPPFEHHRLYPTSVYCNGDVVTVELGQVRNVDIGDRPDEPVCRIDNLD